MAGPVTHLMRSKLQGHTANCDFEVQQLGQNVSGFIVVDADAGSRRSNPVEHKARYTNQRLLVETDGDVPEPPVVGDIVAAEPTNLRDKLQERGCKRELSARATQRQGRVPVLLVARPPIAAALL